jgi:hypothetical protein
LGFHHHFPPGLTAEQLHHYHHHHHPHQGTDASAMKEYAENTMKELLSIYGLNSPDMAETITKNVPIANFSSGEYSYHIYSLGPLPTQFYEATFRNILEFPCVESCRLANDM